MTESDRQPIRIDLRFVAYPDGEGWVAHCLELDLVAQGQSADEAFGNLVELCDFQIETAAQDGDLESIFRPAPSQFWALYSRGKPRRKSFSPESGYRGRIDVRSFGPFAA